jgi:serine/threonine protein kinase
MFDAEGSAGVLKVIDLGSAEFLQPNQAAARAFGTVRYCSPEMAKDVCGQRSDVWSAGVVMYQVWFVVCLLWGGGAVMAWRRLSPSSLLRTRTPHLDARAQLKSTTTHNTHPYTTKPPTI